MTRLIPMIAGISLLLTAWTAAQDAPPPRPGPLLDRLPQLLDDFELTPEQRRQVEDAIEEARQEIQALRREVPDLLPRERVARIDELVRELRDEVMAALDSDQRERLRRRIDRLQERWRETAPAREQISGRMLQRLRESMRQLELTPEQREEIDQILSQAREQMQEMQQHLEEEMHRRREEIRQLFEQTREDLHDVLTPEQRQRLRDLLPPPPEADQ
jgi:Spy/CpxP family protein refolding chaperone